MPSIARMGLSKKQTKGYRSIENSLKEISALIVALTSTIRFGLSVDGTHSYQNDIYIKRVFENFRQLGLIHFYEASHSSSYGVNWMMFRYPKRFKESLKDITYSNLVMFRATRSDRQFYLMVGIRRSDKYIFFDVLPCNPKVDEPSVYWVPDLFE
jgi:hypothetical protein